METDDPILMKYLILSLVMILFDTCEQSTNLESNWDIWETETLKHYQLGFQNIIVLNNKLALLFGDEDTPENSKKMSEKQNHYFTGFAVIYKTNDGGKTWEKQSFEKGGFIEICKSGNTLYATKVVNHGRFAKKTSILYRSIDQGQTWEAINEFIGQAVFLALDENANGYIGGLKADSNQRNAGVYEIVNGQMQEQTDKISYPAHWKAEAKEILYLKSSEIKGKVKNLLCVFDTQKKDLSKYELPEGVDGYFADKHEKEYWVIGRKNEQCCIYRKTETGNFELVHCFNSNERIFPESIKVFGTEIIAVIGTRKSAWTESTTYFSSDFGKSWHEEKLPKPQYLAPFDFIQTERGIFGMAYSGNGTVQVRKK